MINVDTTDYRDVSATVPFVREYTVLQERLLILCEHPDLAEPIECYLRHLTSLEEDRYHTAVRLAIFDSPPNHVILCSPEGGLAERIPLGVHAWVAFRRFFMALVTSEQESHYPFHACCVGNCDGRAALVCGASNAGKTSVLTALLQREYDLIADDYSLVGFQDAKVVSLPTGATMTAHTFSLFPELEVLKRDACRLRCGRKWSWTVDLGEYFTVATPGKSFDISHVFLLMPNFGGESKLEDIPPEEALWVLHESTLHAPARYAHPSHRYQTPSRDLMLRIARSTPFYRLWNGDVQKTADLIAQEFG